MAVERSLRPHAQMLLRRCCSAGAPVARIRPLVHLSSPFPGSLFSLLQTAAASASANHALPPWQAWPRLRASDDRPRRRRQPQAGPVVPLPSPCRLSLLPVRARRRRAPPIAGDLQKASLAAPPLYFLLLPPSASPSKFSLSLAGARRRRPGSSSLAPSSPDPAGIHRIRGPATSSRPLQLRRTPPSPEFCHAAALFFCL